eukprot:TRINITY_DN3872_c0_g1_i1.p1 TRINITY_DN3872_c0_g1~~TRINITY_DN3872_c0_g1_i1.p1  ORF type:complete len:581 (+),score=109.51 TRINITY_DN3872_c0_g1_i1:372-2114(+)
MGDFQHWETHVSMHTGARGDLFVVPAGTVTTPFSENPIAEISSYAVVSDGDGPGRWAMLQTFKIPEHTTPVILSYDFYAFSFRGEDVSLGDDGVVVPVPPSLETTHGMNQHARVDVLTSTADPFSVDDDDVVINLYEGADNSRVLFPTFKSYRHDITDFVLPGQTLKIRFAAASNLDHFSIGVDNFRVGLRSASQQRLETPSPSPSPSPSSSPSPSPSPSPSSSASPSVASVSPSPSPSPSSGPPSASPSNSPSSLPSATPSTSPSPSCIPLCDNTACGEDSSGCGTTCPCQQDFVCEDLGEEGHFCVLTEEVDPDQTTTEDVPLFNEQMQQAEMELTFEPGSTTDPIEVVIQPKRLSALPSVIRARFGDETGTEALSGVVFDIEAKNEDGTPYTGPFDNPVQHKFELANMFPAGCKNVSFELFYLDESVTPSEWKSAKSTCPADDRFEEIDRVTCEYTVAVCHWTLFMMGVAPYDDDDDDIFLGMRLATLIIVCVVIVLVIFALVILFIRTQRKRRRGKQARSATQVGGPVALNMTPLHQTAETGEGELLLAGGRDIHEQLEKREGGERKSVVTSPSYY